MNKTTKTLLPLIAVGVAMFALPVIAAEPNETTAASKARPNAAEKGAETATRLAADEGDEEAKMMIEEMEGMGEYLRQQKEAMKLVEKIEALAAAGDPDAKCRKSRMDDWKEKGNAIHGNVKRDDEQMIKRMLFYWLTMPAVEAGYVPWFFEAGREFATGEIVPKDMAEVSKWFQLAADFGNETAAFYLGLGYLKGIGVDADDWKGVQLLMRASNGGHPDARPVLNSLAKTYRVDAEKGNPSAQFFMGVAYENAYGVERDFAKAAEWYRKAAERGHPGSIKILEQLKGQ